MRVPLSWLKDYVALPESPDELVERLTLAGLESSGVRTVGVPAPPGLVIKPADLGLVWQRDQILVAQVTKIERHPDADKLKLVTVEYGATEPKTVVTGAPNIAPGQSGMKVVLGLRGCQYYYQDKDGKKTIFTLEPKALRGIMNDAMCMSNYELGIADDHDGIIILDDTDPVPGTPLQDVLGDIIVELDVLPNMARCLSLLGIAREVAALTGGVICPPKPKYPIAGTSDNRVSVTIADATLCARYAAAIVENVTLGPAPRWMRSRLQAAGMRPINAVVDVTNYVMLEYGQPLHAFDYDVLVKRAGGQAPTIIVRAATAGEKLITLDGVERTLLPEHLVIADTAGPIALAGVMGGLETEVTDTTKSILLESANFDPVSIRKAARQFNLFSEASTRFSKGIHPSLVPDAGNRALQLLHEHAGATVLAGWVDSYPAPPTKSTIELNRSEIERILGVGLPDAEVERILAALEYHYEATPWGWAITPPDFRTDIQAGAADIIEDLARVSGYDRLPSRLLPTELPTPLGNLRLEYEDRIKDTLADIGLFECITYSLSSSEAEAKLHPAQEHAQIEFVALQNPISPERSVLRRSLLPGLLEVAARNTQQAERVALFELGAVFQPNGHQLPHEPQRLAIVLTGRCQQPTWDDPLGLSPKTFDFFDMKGVLEVLFQQFQLDAVTYEPLKTSAHLHPGRAATVHCSQHCVGQFGELHPKVAAAFGLHERAVLVAELDLEILLFLVPQRVGYQPFTTLPAAKRDIAVIVPDDMPLARVLTELRAAGGELLTDVALFDVYKGDSIPPGTKSLAFALTYQPKEKTLTEKEIDKAHQKIEGRLVHVLKAVVRGKEAAGS